MIIKEDIRENLITYQNINGSVCSIVFPFDPAMEFSTGSEATVIEKLQGKTFTYAHLYSGQHIYLKRKSPK